ncbi:MAG: threonine/serine dehydratase [Terricaulis silvestris]
MRIPTLDDIRAAAKRIAPVAVRTPLLRSDALEARVGGPAFVKAECLQRGGAFKIRGAYNKIASLSEDERARGVLAYSSGNHAIAVATAAKLFGVPAVIVMPADAPRAKLERTRALGAEIVTFDRVRESREAISAQLETERKLPVVRPFDDPLVMAGQGTIGQEIAEDLATLGLHDAVVVSPASGGGLAGGVAMALEGVARVYAVEPEGHDDLKRSVAAGEIVANAPGVRSICDALMALQPSDLTLAVARSKLAGIFTVSDDDVRRAMRFGFEELKLVIEPGGAAGLAAALKGLAPKAGALVVIASGGNVDAEMFASAIASVIPDDAQRRSGT